MDGSANSKKEERLKMQVIDVSVMSTVYDFWWDTGVDSGSCFVELKTTGLTKEELKNKVQEVCNSYRKTKPREYDIRNFLLYLRKNGIPAEEFGAEEEMYF